MHSIPIISIIRTRFELRHTSLVQQNPHVVGKVKVCIQQITGIFSVKARARVGQAIFLFSLSEHDSTQSSIALQSKTAKVS